MTLPIQHLFADNGENPSLTLLKQHFPQCFDKHGAFLPEKMAQQFQSADLPVSREYYTMNWLGKSYARYLSNCPPNTLLGEDTAHNALPHNQTSQNLLIKGDNLEVLKHLNNAYASQVKMIYIDPPYNTGSDGFVYQDDRKFTPEKLAELADMSLDEARRVLDFTAKKSNSHSAWLTFMYPRLYVARELLKDDGVIFISIDDNEQAQLKLLCDEVFGEENFRGNFIARRHDKNLNRQFTQNGLKTFNVGFENILAYGKSENLLFLPVYKEASEDRQQFGYWKGFWNGADRPTMRYPLLGVTPNSGQWKWQEIVASEAVKNYEEFIDKYSKEMSLEEFWEKTGREKKFIKRNPNGKGKNLGVEHWVPPSDGSLRTTNLTDLLVTGSVPEVENVFDFPKNIALIKLFVEMCDENSLILDFFAGSGTTAHAVMQLNAQDNGNRRFICVQLPETTDPKSEAHKAGYHTIFDITKARIEKSAVKIRQDFPDYQGDLGFKIFETVPDFRITDDELSPQIAMPISDDLSDDDYHTLLTTWRVFDGNTLTQNVQTVQLGDCTANLCGTTLYLIYPYFDSQAIKSLLDKLDNDKDFIIERIILFSKNIESAKQMELHQAIETYKNKKNVNLSLLVRC